MRRMEDKQQVMVIIFLLAAICYISCARECVPAYGYQSCACYMEGVNNTKEYVNLLPLKGNSSIPRFTTKDDKGFYLSFSPCDEFSEFVGENNTGYVPCVNASVARWTKESTHRCESLGDEASGTFKSDAVISGFIKSNLTLNFKSAKSAHHSAVISLVCNDSLLQNEAIFKYVGTQNIPTDTYYLSLTSLCCCPGKCGFPPVIPNTTATSPTVSSVIPNTTATSPTVSSVIPNTTGTATAAKQSGDLKTWQIIVIVAGGVLFLLLIIGLICCCKQRAGYQQV